MSSKGTILRLFGRAVKKEAAKWRLHPLIHTLLKFNLAQDIELSPKLHRSLKNE